MGKTSLLFHILAHARRAGCNTVYINLERIEKERLTSLDRFLRWFCTRVSDGLKLENHIDTDWNTRNLGSNDNCANYFEKHFLSTSKPLILALDGIERLFPCKEWVDDFFGLLRSWHDELSDENDVPWKRLGLIFTYSTEEYIPLDTKDSPLNVGIPVELNEFDKQQIQNLAKRRLLEWTTDQVQQLMSVVGGHPYLVQLATYCVSTNEVSLEDFLSSAYSITGPYSSHLQSLLGMLEDAPDILNAAKKVFSSLSGIEVELTPFQTRQLYRLGLVKLQKNHVIPRNDLYRKYFYRVLCEGSER